jgi:hypothetical protein
MQDSDVGFELTSWIRSDGLRDLRELLAVVPAFRPLWEMLVQTRLIVDANIVQSELRWRLARRLKKDARSALHEAIDAGVVIPFAPFFLKSEIEEHIEEIALESGATVAEALAEWRAFEPHVLFYEPQASTDSDPAVDLDDLPYKHAYQELAATAVYTKDRHLQRMNVPVLTVSLDTTMRRFARSSSVLVHITLGSTVAATISLGALVALFQLVKQAAQAFRRLPTAIQVGAGAMAMGLLIHPKSREKIKDFSQSLRRRATQLEPILRPFLDNVAHQFFAALAEAGETRKEIESVLPATTKRTAITHARAICLMSKEPLSLAEIERRMRDHGYVTRSANFATYLRRLLRTSKQFAEVSPGMWNLQQLRT